jgi:RNA polymerase sigma-70 factor (ECF subfamily)
MENAESIGETDMALVRRAQAGDEAAFGRLVERYMRRAYYAALSLVGSREDALDLSQEAFARAYRSRAAIDPERPFYAWLYQILRRLCFNFLRDRKTRVRALEQAGSWLAADAAHRAGPGPAEALEQEERRRLVAAAIETLPDREREVLALKEFEGLSYKEIAALVGVPIGTVMSRLYSARKRLLQALEVNR